MSSGPVTMSLMVGNIDKGTSEQELCLHFGNRCGESPRVKIQRDSKTGQSLGYAFLEFQEKEAYSKAVSLDKSQFRGRALKVRASKLVTDLNNDEANPIDSLRLFEMQLNRRFVPRSIAPFLRRCPGCFMTLVAEDFATNGTVYYCAKCHKMTKLFRDYDERVIMVQCLICFDLFNVDQMIACRAEHMFCTKCIDRWLKHCTTHGTAGKTYLPCPNCESIFLRSEIADRVNEKQLEIFENTLAKSSQIHEAAIREPTNDDSTLFRRCPKCKYSWIADEEKKGAPRRTGATRCPQPGCWYAFCKICFSPWDADLSVMQCAMCNTMAKAKEQLYWENRKEKILKRHCPRCSLELFRNDGCNCVICSRCRTSMCYICREADVNPIEHYCRCFRSLEKPDEHQCKKRCLIFQDSFAYDAEQLRLLEEERERTESVMGTINSSPMSET